MSSATPLSTRPSQVRLPTRRPLLGRLVGLRELTGAQEAAWRALAARALDPNPLAEPDCVLAAATHLPHGHHIHLLVAEDPEDPTRLYGATPVRRINRQGPLPFPVATTDIRRMTYLGTPLVDPERGVETWRAMLLALSGHRGEGGWAYFVVRWIGEGDVAADLRTAASGLGFPTDVLEDFEQPFVVRRADGAYTAGRSEKHLRDYRRRARSLAELLGADLEVVNRADDPAGVDEFFALEAAGPKGSSAATMATALGEPEYFKEMCRRFAASGRLHLLALRADKRTLAMQISIEAGAGLFLVRVAHDEAFDRFDPGTELHLRAMDYFHRHTGAQWIDVCTVADNDLLLGLYPDRRRTSTVLVGLGGHLHHSVVRALPTARAVLRRASGLFEVMGSRRSSRDDPGDDAT